MCHFDPQRRHKRKTYPPEYWQARKGEPQSKDERREAHHVMKLILLIEKLRHGVRFETGEKNDRQHDQKGQHSQIRHTAVLV